MALEVTWLAGPDKRSGNACGAILGRVDATLSGTSASVGTVPAGTTIARIKAGEACYVSNAGTASSTLGHKMAADDVIDLEVISLIEARTA